MACKVCCKMQIEGRKEEVRPRLRRSGCWYGGVAASTPGTRSPLMCVHACAAVADDHLSPPPAAAVVGHGAFLLTSMLLRQSWAESPIFVSYSQATKLQVSVSPLAPSMILSCVSWITYRCGATILVTKLSRFPICATLDSSTMILGFIRTQAAPELT